MHFNHFFNLCEKCQSDILYETEEVINKQLICIYKLLNYRHQYKILVNDSHKIFLISKKLSFLCRKKIP